ncbi:MAG: PrsW family glutamic-type intramembrane protease [Bacteroidia bacterium]|nr:PrsW family glutamic-type intramembrane protease [Bacteroidia bacterium]
MGIWQLLALALGPVAFLFTYVYLRDREREPLRYLITSFILGILIAFPVVWLSGQLALLLNVSDSDPSPAGRFLYAMAVVALSEEGMKYLALRWYAYRKREFDEPYDGIMYAVAVSLGFAAIENVLYVFTSEGPDAVQTGLLRMFTAVPAHAMFGVIMGFFVGRAKFADTRINPLAERLKGLGAAILFHGLYDFFLFLGDTYLVVFSFVTLITGIGLARRAIRLHAAISPFRNGPDAA